MQFRVGASIPLVDRKHHASCETDGDPHSPQTRGIWKVISEGSELYTAEARNEETLRKFSHGTPTDWMERNALEPVTVGGGNSHEHDASVAAPPLCKIRPAVFEHVTHCPQRPFCLGKTRLCI